MVSLLDQVEMLEAENKRLKKQLLNKAEAKEIISFNHWLYDKVFITTMHGVKEGEIVDINFQAFNNTLVKYSILYKIRLINYIEVDTTEEREAWLPEIYIYKTAEAAKKRNGGKTMKKNNEYEDDTMKPELMALKELAKQRHDERVKKTPDRIKYAQIRFSEEQIEYVIKNISNGHIHVYDKAGNIHQIWVSTGKYMLNPRVVTWHGDLKGLRDKRGIENFIKVFAIINRRL